MPKTVRIIDLNKATPHQFTLTGKLEIKCGSVGWEENDKYFFNRSFYF